MVSAGLPFGLHTAPGHRVNEVNHSGTRQWLVTGRCVQIRQLFLLFGENLTFCRGWPSALLETSTNQEQLSSVLLMKRNRSPLQAIHMVILPNTERHIWARLPLEIAGGGSRDCLLMQSDTHCSQSGPFYQSPYYLTLMAFSISI